MNELCHRRAYKKEMYITDLLGNSPFWNIFLAYNSPSVWHILLG